MNGTLTISQIEPVVELDSGDAEMIPTFHLELEVNQNGCDLYLHKVSRFSIAHACNLTYLSQSLVDFGRNCQVEPELDRAFNEAFE